MRPISKTRHVVQIAVGALLLSLSGGLCLAANDGYAYATGAISDACKPAHAQRVAEGVAALQAGSVQRAVYFFRPVVEDEPGCHTAAHGAAAYWLGVAHQRAGQMDQSLQVWAAGVETYDTAAVLDARLIDAFVQQVFTRRTGTYYHRAAEAYLHLLEQAGDSVPAFGADRLVQHLRLVATVLQPTLRKRFGVSEDIDASRLGTLPDRVGQSLATWWRGQDPVPATEANERVEEHLERVAYVRDNYQAAGRIDDRGQVYVRLGPPSRHTKIQFNSIRFSQSVLITENLRFNSADFKAGEFWTYEHISRSTQYLFVEVENDVYQIGNVISMLPNELQRGFSSSSRGQQEARAFIRAMEEAYSQLAIYHDRYHMKYQDLANYTLNLDNGTTGSVTQGNRAIRSFARRTLLDTKNEDEFFQRERETNTPFTYTDESPDCRPMPIAVRHARFLQSDGQTQTELFWSAPYGALLAPEERPDSGTYLLHTTLVRRGPQGKREETRQSSSLIPVNQVDENAFSAPKTHRVTVGAGESFQLDAQWNQYEAVSENQFQAGASVGCHIYRSDTLQAFSTDASKLLLSDLRPMVVPGRDAFDISEALPYPFAGLTPNTPLVLYFEVYHLAFGDEDRTRYTVEYEVERETEEGLFVRLFRGSDAQRTALRATYEGSTRTAEEHIVLDFDAWDGDGVLSITVRVTDEITGQTDARTIKFGAS